MPTTQDHAQRLLRDASWNLERAFDSFYAGQTAGDDEWETAVIAPKKKKEASPKAEPKPKDPPTSKQQGKKRDDRGNNNVKRGANKRGDASKPAGADGPAGTAKGNDKQDVDAPAADAKATKAQQQRKPQQQQKQQQQKQPQQKQQKQKQPPPQQQQKQKKQQQQQQPTTKPSAGNPAPATAPASQTPSSTGSAQGQPKPSTTAPSKKPAATAQKKQTSAEAQSVRDREKARLEALGVSVAPSGMMQVHIPDNLKSLMALDTLQSTVPVQETTTLPVAATSAVTMPPPPVTQSVTLPPPPVTQSVTMPQAYSSTDEHNFYYQQALGMLNTTKDICDGQYELASKNLNQVFRVFRDHLEAREQQLMGQLNRGHQDETDQLTARMAQLSHCGLEQLKMRVSHTQSDMTSWEQPRFCFHEGHVHGWIADIPNIGVVQPHGAQMPPPVSMNGAGLYAMTPQHQHQHPQHQQHSPTHSPTHPHAHQHAHQHQQHQTQQQHQHQHHGHHHHQPVPQQLVSSASAAQERSQAEKVADFAAAMSSTATTSASMAPSPPAGTTAKQQLAADAKPQANQQPAADTKAPAKQRPAAKPTPKQPQQQAAGQSRKDPPARDGSPLQQGRGGGRGGRSGRGGRGGRGNPGIEFVSTAVASLLYQCRYCSISIRKAGSPLVCLVHQLGRGGRGSGGRKAKASTADKVSARCFAPCFELAACAFRFVCPHPPSPPPPSNTHARTRTRSTNHDHADNVAPTFGAHFLMAALSASSPFFLGQGKPVPKVGASADTKPQREKRQPRNKGNAKGGAGGGVAGKPE